MPNPNPKLENLEKGRNKPKLGKKEFSLKLTPKEKEQLEHIAQIFGYTYGNKGSISGLLQAIAKNDLMIVNTPSSHQLSLALKERDEVQKALDEYLDEYLQEPKKEFAVKLRPLEKEQLEHIAQIFGYTYKNKGSISGLLQAIATDSLMIVNAPTSHQRILFLENPMNALDEYLDNITKNFENKSKSAFELDKSL